MTALSGSKERMHTYMSWKLKGCVPSTGIVKVIAKPQHGKLTPSNVEALIGHSRHRSNDPCIGKPMKGFRVDYQSEPGFRGTDTFKIEVTFGKRVPEIDTNTITVR